MSRPLSFGSVAPALGRRAGGRLGTVTLAVAALLVATAAGGALASRPPSTALLVAVLGAGAVVALAIGRYGVVVALGFGLLGVVKVEPAPSDALLTIAIGLGFATGRLDLRRVPAPMGVALVVLLALNLLSAIAAVDFAAALRFLAITLYLVVFAIWLTLWLSTADRTRLVVRAYVAGAVASVAITLPAVFGVPFPGATSLIGEGVRAQGLFKDPNVFGPFLVPAALIALEEVLRPRVLGLRRSTSVVVLAALTLGVVFAYSRAGWLNLVVGIAVMLCVLGARADAGPRVAAVLVVVVALAALGVTAIGATGSGAILRERAQAHQSYDSERFDAQRSGVRLAEEHPLGVGPGQFDVVETISSHSIYVRVLAEQGVLGLLALVILLGGTLALALGNALAGRATHGVGSAALLGAWCGLLANSAFVDTLHWRHLWLLAALIWVGSRRPRR
jgi:O-antigen ligase